MSIAQSGPGDGSLPLARRSQRPTAYLAAITLFEALQYAITDYPPGTVGTAIAWACLSAYLVRRVWQRGPWAREVLMALNAVGVALLTWVAFDSRVYTGQGWVRGVTEFLLMAAEVVLLTRPQIRRWVSPE